MAKASFHPHRSLQLTTFLYPWKPSLLLAHVYYTLPFVLIPLFFFQNFLSLPLSLNLLPLHKSSFSCEPCRPFLCYHMGKDFISSAFNLSTCLTIQPLLLWFLAELCLYTVIFTALIKFLTTDHTTISTALYLLTFLRAFPHL